MFYCIPCFEEKNSNLKFRSKNPTTLTMCLTVVAEVPNK